MSRPRTAGDHNEHQEQERSQSARRARAAEPQDRVALVEDVLDGLDNPDPDIDRTIGARGERPRLGRLRRSELAAKDLRQRYRRCRP